MELVGRGLGLRLRLGRLVRVALPWMLRSTRVSRRFLETISMVCIHLARA